MRSPKAKFAPNKSRFRPRFISLFSGCGGFDLGFIQAGFTPIAAYDNWPLAIENYQKNIGDHAHVWDLSKGQLPSKQSCDVILAGSPCQGFSTAGKRLLDDPRNDLLHAAVKIAIANKPKAIVFENVLGVLQGAHRKHWDKASAKLHSAGYQTTTSIIDARETGAPQTRKRVVMIAWTGRAPALAPMEISEIPSLLESLQGVEGLSNHEPRIIPQDSKEIYIASRIAQGQKLCNVRAGEASVHTWDIPEAFGETTDSERQLLVTVMRLRRRARIRDFGDADPVSIEDLEREMGRGVKREVGRLVKKDFLRWVGSSIDLRHTFNGKYRRPHPEGHSYTVDSKFGDPRHFLHPLENRGFSVREAARIQGFPDDFVFQGSLRDQFKLVANAVPPCMGYVIGKMVKRALKD